jgi:hypothetical protein
MKPAPTAAGLAFRVQRFTDSGTYAADLFTREPLRLKWAPPIPCAPHIARLRDGTCCTVPANATPPTLATYFTAAKIAKILEGSDALDC